LIYFSLALLRSVVVRHLNTPLITQAYFNCYQYEVRVYALKFLLELIIGIIRLRTKIETRF